MNPVAAKSAGPGRPKDLEKRAAILDAAKRLFPLHGFEGTSMDAIAAVAGVSKLTVYSHFQDKETLFRETVRAKCEQMLPAELFTSDLRGSVRRQLETIARAFFNLITSPEAIALNRLMSAATTSPKLAQLFWEGGPRRTHEVFGQFLAKEVDAGRLDIPDIPRACSQFFGLLKGEMHARLLCGCTQPIGPHEVDAHIKATVDMFLRAYTPCRTRGDAP